MDDIETSEPAAPKTPKPKRTPKRKTFADEEGYVVLEKKKHSSLKNDSTTTLKLSNSTKETNSTPKTPASKTTNPTAKNSNSSSKNSNSSSKNNNKNGNSNGTTNGKITNGKISNSASKNSTSTPKNTTPTTKNTKLTPKTGATSKNSTPKNASTKSSNLTSKNGTAAVKSVSKTSKPQKCQKVSCPNTGLVCFARSCKNCAQDGSSSRWYHMSNEEHFCNECFDYFYRTHKDGFKLYEPWKAHWSASCRKEATLKIFMGEEILPFWTQCTLCEKWRRLDEKVVLTQDMAASFKCTDVDDTNCKAPELEMVNKAKHFSWIPSATCLPYLKDSPAAPFLKDFYYDGIGLSPPKSTPEEPNETFSENMIPFYSAEDSEKARCICADVMTEEERKFFPQYVKDGLLYLGLRNLVMSLWSINPKQYLSYKSCVSHLICRGLGRVTLTEELKKILDFLTINGYINFGILPKVQKPFNLDYWKGSVIVIGAGIAGVGAARQLKNAGCTVKVLEASERCGGRMKDDHSLGNCIGLGAQIITGCINNPLYVMSNQAGIGLRYLGMQCDLIDDNGKLVENAIDQEVEFRFNLMLDSLEEWKQSIDKRKHESFSLSEALAEQLKELQKSLCKNMTQVEKDLLQFHLGNLEYGCGSSLQNVSAVHWNQNEEFPQYSGAHAWAVDGFEKIVHKLAENINVCYNAVVSSIDYSGKKVKVKTKGGETHTADKVVCALPLTIYQSKLIQFNPELPKEKQSAIDRLGAGLIEKIALKFSRPFWRKKIGDADYFGHVPSSVNDRGMFSVFYDVSKGNNYILMTVVAGEAVKQKAEMTDEELVKKCMKTLKNIFKDEKVPNPSSYVVSHWATDPNIKMAYSFVKVGSSGKDCDIIAQTTEDKLYFAGEHTNRQFPQTVTGAYLSGLREAKNILQSGTT